MHKFLKLHNISYKDLPYSGEHESVHDYSHKKQWGKLGVKMLKDIAKSLNLPITGAHHNWSGDIDRGQVTAFISSVDGSRHIYISMSDSVYGGLLYRTAEHVKDYTGGSNNIARIDEQGIESLVEFIKEQLIIKTYV